MSFFRWNPVPELWVSGLCPGSLLRAPPYPGSSRALAANTATIITIISPMAHHSGEGAAGSSRHIFSALVPTATLHQYVPK